MQRTFPTNLLITLNLVKLINNMKGIFEFPYFPIIGVVCLFLLYVLFEQAFVYCNLDPLIRCEQIQGNLISNNNKTSLNLDGIGKSLEEAQANLDRQNSQLNAKEREFQSAQIAFNEKVKSAPAAGPEPVDSTVSETFDAEKTRLESISNALKTEVAEVTAERNKTASGIVEMRKNISSRYSSRLIWTFLAAIFLILCISAVVVSRSVIAGSSNHKWFNVTTIVAGVFAIAVFVTIYFPNLNYMAVILPMFEKTIYQNGDLAVWPVNLFNVLGFGATIFLVSASSFILSSVVNIEKEDTAKPNPKTLIAEYDKQLKNLKAILYIGALMLFVGVLQLKLLTDWHIVFISTNPEDASLKLLSEFFKASIGVRAGYYAIMLAVIYLPVGYIIQQKVDSIAVTSEENKKLVDDKGLAFSFTDFLPRLLIILSPFLAGPIVQLVSYVSTSGN